MATIVFYEKPGCGNNTRQKNLLAEAGHELIVRNLLTTPWTVETLRPFFGGRPVAEWFNRAAPRVKAGEVVPENLDETEALALMLKDPLLIRRPLMQVGEAREVGFDPGKVAAWIGLGSAADAPAAHLEQCQRPHPCPPPESTTP
ncbi:nitrogenase-associated protein [Methylomagnum ishizawai]|uniref:Nitrogenase-associated protein n=1 Tax=Methylomagnum ishizawai TaxID=1760988 RepID=A0A1Y6DDE6_9GAMM|nr:ArsC/Spx/MgsR family protein [Methylomagnum ishizawai]SMF97525.1 nitrogenase-associated protein [Methylomagnum ishizawai]